MYEGNAGILLMYFAKMDDVVIVKCHNSMSKVAALLVDISDVFDDILVYSNNKMEWFSYKGCCSLCV